ncbi:hypothetical protein [Streptomyces sp. NPDC058989]|uniref:hypothetical protein n=1 Tax=Streptomyces sp. NPDC058989 TaxID=3346686 RepID=UPI00369DD84D
MGGQLEQFQTSKGQRQAVAEVIVDVAGQPGPVVAVGLPDLLQQMRLVAEHGGLGAAGGDMRDDLRGPYPHRRAHRRGLGSDQFQHRVQGGGFEVFDRA